MTFYNADTLLKNLNPSIYKKLVQRLNNNNEWKKVAELIQSQYQVFGSDIIEDIGSSKSPADRLLCEMGYKDATVENLIDLLENLELTNSLMLLKPTEHLVFKLHPGNGKKVIPLLSPLKLECEATGFPPPLYQWYFQNQPLDNETLPSLSIDKFLPENCGSYMCCVSHTTEGGNHVKCVSTVLDVRALPKSPEIKIQPLLQVVTEGGHVTLKCEVIAYPEPAFQWFKDNSLKSNMPQFHIEKVTLQDDGMYKCFIKNDHGELYTDNVRLVVNACHKVDSFATGKSALLIANDTYDMYPRLVAPANDAALLYKQLTNLGFDVTVLYNLRLNEMESALELFCSNLCEGMYGIFYFVGHGSEIGENVYLLPVDAPCGEHLLRKYAYHKTKVSDKMIRRNIKLCFTIYDVCRSVPDKSKNTAIFEESVEHLAVTIKDVLVEAFATTSQCPAFESQKLQNGFYITLLEKYLPQRLSVIEMLDRVATDMKHISKERKSSELSQQMPSYTSNLSEPHLSLHDQVKESPESKKCKVDYTKLANFTPKSVVLNFPKLGINRSVNACVALRRYKNCIFNSIEVLWTESESWPQHIKAHICCPAKELCYDVNPGRIKMTVHGLHKQLDPYTINIFLYNTQEFCYLCNYVLVFGPIQLAQKLKVIEQINSQETCSSCSSPLNRHSKIQAVPFTIGENIPRGVLQDTDFNIMLKHECHLKPVCINVVSPSVIDLDTENCRKIIE